MKPAFFFYANPYRPRSMEAAKALEKCLEERNCFVYAESWMAGQGIGQAAELAQMTELGVRALVAFGGDGTLLRVSNDAALQDVPMLGVNAGTVGFLMDGDAGRPEATAQMLLAQEYEVESFPLLDVAFKGAHYLALNDISLTRGEHPGVIETTVFADGERVMGAHGDGIVVSTPLGSTAYALSSGGPIIRPDVPCLTVTPIAARELLLRPVILPLESKVTLLAYGRDRRRLQLAIDGAMLLPITDDARVEIAVSDYRAKLIRPDGHQFFSTLRKKQKIWNQDEEQE